MNNDHEPHTGPRCSTECEIPCGHTYCTYCELYTADKARKDEAAKRMMQRVATSSAAKPPPKPKGMLGGMSPQNVKDMQTTTITRAALEGLVARAGLEMNWNNGNPIIQYDEETKRVESIWVEAEQKARQQKVDQVKDVIAKQAAGELTAQAANRIAQNAIATMDETINDILGDAVKGHMKRAVEAQDARIKEELKSKGATDEDIAAAEKALRASIKAAPKETYEAFDASDIINKWKPQSQKLPPGHYVISPYAKILRQPQVMTPGPGSAVEFVSPPPAGNILAIDYTRNTLTLNGEDIIEAARKDFNG